MEGGREVKRERREWERWNARVLEAKISENGDMGSGWGHGGGSENVWWDGVGGERKEHI